MLGRELATPVLRGAPGSYDEGSGRAEGPDVQLEPVRTPVVLIIHRRPDMTKLVLREIARVKPRVLLVVGDGARTDRPGEAEQVRAARAAVDEIEWDCRVLRNYAERNLGLAERVSSGLDWVFSLYDRAVVLEDDCVPDPSFFRLCDELLERYEDDERIVVISGDNFQFGRNRTQYSYYFSRYNHCWGWATWRRAWHHYDHQMRLWPEVRDGGWLEDILSGDKHAVRYWSGLFQAVYDGEIDSWAYRWTLACWLQSGLTVLPRANLVSNVGFSDSATHTKRRGYASSLPTEPLTWPLRHPPFLVRDAQADGFTQRHYFGTGLYRRLRRRAGAILRAMRLRQ